MNFKNSTEYKIGSKIGSVLGTALYKICSFVFNLIYSGIIRACMKYKLLIVFYVGLLAIGATSFLLFGHYGIPLFMFLVMGVAMTIREYIEELPTKRRRKYFNEMFDKIGFRSHDKKLPYFIEERSASSYIQIFSFYSLIPLHEWKRQKETLEVYFNATIDDVWTKTSNNQIIEVSIQTKALPENILWDDSFVDYENDALNFGLGTWGIVDIDLKLFPHTFIAGETGSGKSNILKCLIHQAIIKDYDVTLIDFKRGVSFASFSDVTEVCYEYPSVLKVLKEAVLETTNRLDKFRDNNVDNIYDYCKVTGEFLKRKIIFIDELAELLKVRDKELSNTLTDSVETLTRLSRSAGIHLIMGLQRPDSTIVSGQIKNNVSLRICGRYVDKEPSRIMLGSSDASTLPNIKGRFLVKDDDLYQVQCFYFQDVNKSYYGVRKDDSISLKEITDKEKTSENETESLTKSLLKDKQEPQRMYEVSESLQFDFNDLIKKK